MGATNSGSGKPMQFFALKAKVDEANKPFFSQSEKIDDVWKQTNTFDTISGVLSGAKIEEKDLKGHGKKKFFVLYIEDDNGVCKLDMSHNNITYSIINSLAHNCNSLSNYSIQVYRAKPVEKDGKTYHNGRAAVKIEGKNTEWFIQPYDAPKKEPVMVKGKPMMKDGKPVYDDTEVREFWEKMFTDRIVSVLGTKSTQGGGGTTNEETSHTYTESSQEDGLPF